MAVDKPLITSEQQVTDTFTGLKHIPRKVDLAKFVDPEFNGSLPPSTTTPRVHKDS